MFVTSNVNVIFARTVNERFIYRTIDIGYIKKTRLSLSLVSGPDFNAFENRVFPI